MPEYFIVYKPFQVLCQFSPVEGKQSLSDYFKVSKDVYPVGRLDFDSEGLLILTNDRSLNNKLLNPSFRHEREYWVEVEGMIDQPAIEKLEKGLDISIDGKQHHTLPAKAHIMDPAPTVPARNPPVRFRKNIPTSWISLALIEGKNRQVRRMTAAVGFPTLRLIRHRIVKITVDGLQPGEMKAFSRNRLFSLLFED